MSVTTFHIQYRGVSGWEAIGAGLGEGEDGVWEALDEVRRLLGGELPAGNYQAVESRTTDPRWETFELDAHGGFVVEEPILSCLRSGQFADEQSRHLTLSEAREQVLEESKVACRRAHAARARADHLRVETELRLVEGSRFTR